MIFTLFQRKHWIQIVKQAQKFSHSFSFLAFLSILLFLAPHHAYADVDLTFYSHDFGSEFPHAFVEAKGTLNDGTVIDEDFGFTAKHISPRVLLGSVKGSIKAPPAAYKASSNPQFRITVSDEVYQSIVLHRETWQVGKKRNYNLNKRNCVHYVGEVLKLTGLVTNLNSSNFKKPKSFLREVLSLNPSLTPYPATPHTSEVAKASNIPAPVETD